LLREWVMQRMPALRPASRQGETSPVDLQMEALRSAKSRVRENQPVLPKERRDNMSKVEAPNKEKSAAEPMLPTIETKPEVKGTPAKQETPASTTSALLARKKNIRK